MSRSREIGYRGLLLLALALPFDIERRPLLWTNYLTVTDLTVLLLGVAALAMIAIGGTVFDAFHGSADAADYFSRRRVPLALLLAFLLSSAVSTLLARSSAQGLSWFLVILTGALLWLALPLWLAETTDEKIGRLGTAIVAGAVVAAGVGIIEVLVGSAFDQRLTFFKFGPSTMGPFLRLSATFSSANVAAMYFELAVPFAVAGLIGAVGRTSRRWVAVAAWLTAIDVLLVALVLTYSRGALLGLLAAGLAMAVASRGAWRLWTHAPWRGVTVVTAANLALVCGFFALSSTPVQLLRFSGQSDRAWYQASYVSTVPPIMVAGKDRTIPVTVENRGPVTWSASNSHVYGLSYHWLYPSWKVVRFANNITRLSSDVRPDGRQTVRAKVKPPSAPGRYLLTWDMVWKSAVWFGPRTGTYQALPVRVIEPESQLGVSSPIKHVSRPDITQLPTAPALDRKQIWNVAIRMIEMRPLFGLGPQGVRMNYVAFVPPNPATQTALPPPHAHNLELEILADWGLFGGGIFFALLAVLWWPLLRRVLTGRVESSWELAVIGAAAALLGHGLVDYPLTKQATFVMFWLLCGLASTMRRDIGANAAVRPVYSAADPPASPEYP